MALPELIFSRTIIATVLLPMPSGQDSLHLKMLLFQTEPHLNTVISIINVNEIESICIAALQCV